MNGQAFAGNISYQDLASLIETELFDPLPAGLIEPEWLELPVIEPAWLELPEIKSEWLELPAIEAEWLQAIEQKCTKEVEKAYNIEEQSFDVLGL